MENDNRFAMQRLDIYQAALQLARRPFSWQWRTISGRS